MQASSCITEKIYISWLVLFFSGSLSHVFYYFVSDFIATHFDSEKTTVLLITKVLVLLSKAVTFSS